MNRECSSDAERWTPINGYRTFARVWEGVPAGGLPIVLVHGLGVSSRYMVPLARELATSYRVYAPDLPGFGRSDGPVPALGIHDLALSLRAWMRETGIGRAVMAGNSLGCEVILELAYVAPEVVAGAVLVGPAMDIGAGFVSQVGRLLLDTYREPVSLLAIAAIDYLRAGPVRVLATVRKALDHDVLGSAAAAPRGTILVRGERDPIASDAWIHRLAARIPGSTIRTIRGAAHAVHYSHPAEVAALVREVACYA